MNNPLVKSIRRLLWKIIGRDPAYEYNIDLDEPRKVMIGYAIGAANHYTRVSREKYSRGEKGSLLGDYLEFGCYKGDSFIYAFKHAAHLMPWMRFYAFDSFKGLPEPAGVDAGGAFWKGQFAYSQSDFIENIKMEKLDMGRIACIPGWFKDSLKDGLKKDLGIKIASIVYIDCDLYESCASVLDFIADIIETGSIIIFDDWFSFKGDPDKGIQLACREWLSKNKNIILQDWHCFGGFGKSFIVKMK